VVIEPPLTNPAALLLDTWGSALIDGTIKQARQSGELDDRALAALMLHVALTNLVNRLNVARRQSGAD
jgi:hypothetical protein